MCANGRISAPYVRYVAQVMCDRPAFERAPRASYVRPYTRGAHSAPWRARRAVRGLHRRRPRQQGARRTEPRRRVSAPPAAPRRRPRSHVPGVAGQPPTPPHVCLAGGAQWRRVATLATRRAPARGGDPTNVPSCAHHRPWRARPQALDRGVCPSLARERGRVVP